MTGAGKNEANAAFDASFLDVYTGGDNEIRNQVLELFLTQVELLLKRLRDAQGDERAWHEAAHSLKGCASGVGANGLAGLARAAEQEKAASEAKQLAIIEDLAAAFRGTAEKVRALLAAK